MQKEKTEIYHIDNKLHEALMLHPKLQESDSVIIMDPRGELKEFFSRYAGKCHNGEERAE